MVRGPSRFARALGLALTLAAAAAAAAATAASPARADDVAQARKQFAEGVQRYRDGDFEGARALFQQANTEHHAAPIVYNIARAEERLAHPQAAVDAYDAYIAEAGETGEFTQAAVLAVARIRASAKELHIESRPAGAHVFIDGAMARDAAPTRVLVPPGRHHVVVEGEGWRAETDVEVKASGPAPGTIALARADAPPGGRPVEAAKPGPPDGAALPPARPLPAPARPPVSEGFVMGAEFAVIPHRFDRTGSRPFSSFGLAAGVILEAGFAPTDDFVLLGRALVAAGSKGSPATTIGSIGVAGTFHVHHLVWLGAAFQAGRGLLPGAINPAPGEERRFDTDYVFCPTLEVSVVVIDKPYGQWLVSVFPGYYFASPTDNDLFYVPIGFGLRTY